MTELNFHARTPSVTVTGSAGTPVRTLAFLRHPDEAGTPARILTTRTLTDPLTRTVRAFGARRLDNAVTGSADAVTAITLAGQPLMLHTADGDVTLTLNDATGRPLWSRNAQGTVSRMDYEPDDGAGRPLSLTEQPAGGSPRRREQYAYAAPGDAALKARNLAGALTEHRHNAGISRPLSFSVTGQALLSEERLLTPEAELPDWSVLTEDDTEDALMMSGTGDATGAPLAQTNAAGVTTLSAYDISGTVRETRLTYTEEGDLRETVILRDILYRADGVVLSQTAGNGVTGTYAYDPRTQRLVRHTTQRPAGHPQGALLISDLHYTYDPAGNILTLDDRGTDPTWHNNQQTTGLRTYAYDTLYRLTSATGRERHAVNPDDPTAGQVWSPYTETYSYDDGDNLTRTVHTGGSGNRTVETVVSAGSNRAIRKADDGTTPDPEAGFLTGGLQKQLSDGRELLWHADGQLRQVSPVVRAEGEADDTEVYRYSDGGTRVRKTRTTQASGGTQTHTTTYAGGTETRQRRLQETLQLDIVVTEAGGVRLIQDHLSGETRLRYAFSDHLNSSGGEADDSGRLTSREEYLPYGGSAGADEEAAESHGRTQRYSGKVRDATGLLYYGWRYYQPDAGRWLSADPGGLIDGVNLFRFCGNNPVTLYDADGRMWEPTEDHRLQPLAERLRKHDLNVFLGILGLEREKSPAPRHIAAYIISGLNNDRRGARKAMEHLEHLELFEDLDSIQQALEPPAHDIPGEIPATNSPPTITSSNPVVVMKTPLSMKIDSQTKNRIDKLRGDITHHRDGNFILSIVHDDMFQNSYHPESWHFEVNYRDKENTDYYASDVVFLQYEEVSKAEGFYGQMPQTIIRKNVINKNTNTVMNEINKSKLPMRQPFLWHTPNGKSTMRIMDLYGLEATKVTRSNNDYIIDVKSKVSSPWRPWLV